MLHFALKFRQIRSFAVNEFIEQSFIWVVCLSKSNVSGYHVWYQLIIVSLHIRSMWETICDAWACWSGWNFGPNSTEYPLFWRVPPSTPRKLKFRQILALWLSSFRIPPPPKNWNLGRSWHFDFSVSDYPPPQPKKLKFRQILALWLSSFRYPPPPWKLKFRQILALWLFSFRIPPQPKKLKLSQILALWLSSFRIPPPPKIEI